MYNLEFVSAAGVMAFICIGGSCIVAMRRLLIGLIEKSRNVLKNCDKSTSFCLYYFGKQ